MTVSRRTVVARVGRILPFLLLATTLSALGGGALAWSLGGAQHNAEMLWNAGTLIAVVPALWWVAAA